MSLEQQIKDKARQLGFDAAGITDASAIDPADVEHFRTWLDSGCSGQMAYMHRNLDKRTSPAALLEGAKSVIVVALGYKPLADNVAQPPSAGIVANMACYDDYHIVIKSLLRELVADIQSQVHQPLRFKICVDSVPLAERALAVRAGLGFIGRSHALIHPALGPQVFLGELVTTLPLKSDDPVNQPFDVNRLRCSFRPASDGGRDEPPNRNRSTICRDCRRCIRACPTGALHDDGHFDARRCISYLTIEHKGDIDPDLSRKIGSHLFGCDECTRVCPFHEAAPPYASPVLKYCPDRARLPLQEILAMDESAFKSRFANSPLLRPGLDTLKRNARICLQNA